MWIVISHVSFVHERLYNHWWAESLSSNTIVNFRVKFNGMCCLRLTIRVWDWGHSDANKYMFCITSNTAVRTLHTISNHFLNLLPRRKHVPVCVCGMCVWLGMNTTPTKSSLFVYILVMPLAILWTYHVCWMLVLMVNEHFNLKNSWSVYIGAMLFTYTKCMVNWSRRRTYETAVH